MIANFTNKEDLKVLGEDIRYIKQDVYKRQGQYHSAFKGRGMSFSEVREYQFGDDIRDIDWKDVYKRQLL